MKNGDVLTRLTNCCSDSKVSSSILMTLLTNQLVRLETRVRGAWRCLASDSSCLGMTSSIQIPMLWHLGYGIRICLQQRRFARYFEKSRAHNRRLSGSMTLNQSSVSVEPALQTAMQLQVSRHRLRWLLSNVAVRSKSTNCALCSTSRIHHLVQVWVAFT